MAEEKGKESIKKFVVVLVRGLVGVNHKIKETLKMFAENLSKLEGKTLTLDFSNFENKLRIFKHN